MTIRECNALSASDAPTFFRQFCNAGRWVTAMVAGRPYADLRELCAAAEKAFLSLSDEEWKEAFAGHPKIGDVNDLRRKFPTTAAMSEGEQAGLSQAPEKILADLASANEQYEKKFGYIFIVCATGKRADEMLAILNERMKNTPRAEIRIAAREQEKITQLRLKKIVS